MSYFARSDEVPEWATQVPEGWSSNWLKWSVDLSTKRPTEEEQEALPYISNEDIASWTGKLLIDGDMPLSQTQEFSSRRIQYVPELLLHLGPAARFTLEVDDVDFLNPRAFPHMLDTECLTLPLREEPPKSQPGSENVTDSLLWRPRQVHSFSASREARYAC